MAQIVEWNNRPDLPAVGIDRSLGFAHPSIAQAHAYWQGLRRGRAMPSRADVDPVEMRGFITHVGLVDPPGTAAKAGEFQIRLAGDHVESVFGAITGRSLPDFLPPELAERWRYAFELVLAEAIPIRFIGRLSFEGKTWLESETLLAPLAGAKVRVTQLFGAFAAWPAGQEPR